MEVNLRRGVEVTVVWNITGNRLENNKFCDLEYPDVSEVTGVTGVTGS